MLVVCLSMLYQALIYHGIQHLGPLGLFLFKRKGKVNLCFSGQKTFLLRQSSNKSNIQNIMSSVLNFGTQSRLWSHILLRKLRILPFQSQLKYTCIMHIFIQSKDGFIVWYWTDFYQGHYIYLYIKYGTWILQ